MSGRPRKIVLTGGPCAGKTTLTQVIAQSFPEKVVTVPEAASLLFKGGFPRWAEPDAVRAAQRAIYRVQVELEAVFAAKYPDRLLVLDRGTVDGAVYWPDGPDRYFADLGTSFIDELARYDHVIYLESAGAEDYAKNQSKNPYRIENWETAHRLDMQTRKLWENHKNFTFVKNQRAFGYKVMDVLDVVEGAL